MTKSKAAKIFPELPTKRQQDVALLSAMGNTNPQIAEKLGLQATTVGTHVERILKRLGLKRKNQLTQLMLKRTKE